MGTGIAIPSPQTALLLSGKNPCFQELVELVNFFGIPWKVVPTGAIAATDMPPDRGQYCVLAYASDVAQVLQCAIEARGALPRWIREASSLYVFGFEDTSLCQNLLRFLTGDAEATIRNPSHPREVISITSDLPEMCGPMSGLEVSVDLQGSDLIFGITHNGYGFRSIITTARGQVFVRTACQDIPVYLNACSKTVDLSSPSDKHFDVRKHFCSAVPITMYLKWAFRNVCWGSPETNACLIIDDPPLKPRYGFLNFREMTELMDERNFTTTIAFIPWNWRRTNRHVVDLFRSRPDRFSVAVHGCDHTANEFATRSAALLDERVTTARKRMNSMVDSSSLAYDSVMVFPQGVFSPETGRALKLNGFVAAANTEVAPWRNEGNETTTRDLWDIAIMKYGAFPIFTRRYLSTGIENFAFDAILGKPCLIAAHHDVLKGHGRELAEFVARLNSLNWNLCWRPLGSALNRSFKVRIAGDGTIVVCVFSKTTVVENSSADPWQALFIKQERNPECIEAVTVNQNAIDFNCDNRYLQFRVRLLPKQTTRVCVRYVSSQKGLAESNEGGIAYQAKARLRRYLSEFRDNYISQSEFLSATAARVRRLRS